MNLYRSINLGTFCLVTHLFSQSVEPVAVLDFTARGVSENETGTLTDRLRLDLVRTGKVTVVERGQMEMILVEQNYGLAGCTSDECAVEVGQLLGVKWMIAGTIGKVGRTFSVDVRIIDVESGMIINPYSISYKGEIDGLLDQMAVIADALVISSFTVRVPISNEQAIAEKLPIAQIVLPSEERTTLEEIPNAANAPIVEVDPLNNTTPSTANKLANEEVQIAEKEDSLTQAVNSPQEQSTIEDQSPLMEEPAGSKIPISGLSNLALDVTDPLKSGILMAELRDDKSVNIDLLREFAVGDSVYIAGKMNTPFSVGKVRAIKTNSRYVQVVINNKMEMIDQRRLIKKTEQLIVPQNIHKKELSRQESINAARINIGVGDWVVAYDSRLKIYLNAVVTHLRPGIVRIESDELYRGITRNRRMNMYLNTLLKVVTE